MTIDNLARDDTGAQVEHDAATSRYTLWLDGEPAGLADYRIVGKELRFTHTEIDPAKRDRGLAAILIEQALDDVRTRTDFTVVALCPYVADWIDQHAEYQDLLTRGR